jgi:hypothetical protein
MTFFVCGGGMTSSSSVERMRLMTSLASGLPGTMAISPDLPLPWADSAQIEAQLAFARVIIHAVAGEALLR